MFPDQNQPQPQNNQSTPVPSTPSIPITPAPFDSAPAQQPITPQPADSTQPAPLAGAPAAFQPAPTMPQAVAPAPAPTPVGMAGPQPVPAPIAPVVDSSQLGYVPPAMPTNPVSANSSKAKGSKFAKIRIILAVAVGLLVFSGGGFLLKDMLFSGSAVTSSDLVEETQAGILFKRPKQWTKSEMSADNKKTYGDESAAFTEDGKSTDLADQGMLVGRLDLGFNFDDLTGTEKQQAIDQFIKQSEDVDSLESDSCQDVTGAKASEVKQPNYATVLSFEYTCNKVKDRAVKLKVKVYFAIKGSTQDVVTIAAIDKTWDKSGDVFDEILNTFKPAE